MEEILANLTARLKSLELENESLKVESHEARDLLTADLDWNDAALRSQFRIGLSSEIKDAWVHFDPPTTLSHAMDLAIKLDNRLFERRQEQRQQQKPVSQYQF
ncbi:hypothetical protein BASA61_001964 [Batrachochytrium salamandrivorans]|nr:hypothetical protein BASA61_001964 [Batrachochytrium salamandrivorans]